MEIKGNICNHCKRQNLSNANFCQFCGNPLTDLAKDLQKERIITSQLLILSQLASKVEDEKTLNLIKSAIKKLED